MLRTAASRIASRSVVQAVRSVYSDAECGKHVFKGAVAAKYLQKQGLAAGTLDGSAWTADMATADKVAAAVMEWARDNGACVYTHWFQPLAASGVREGGTGQVHNRFFAFKKDGTTAWEFEGKTLLKGETDGSSFPNGGLRATHTAGGYTVLDPSSPIFLRGDTIYIPSIFVTWHGHSVDEKTPLLRATEAMSTQAKRLLGLMGFQVEGVTMNIGLEQEFFLIPRDQYLKRLDLQLTGRTVMGKDAPRGQEMCDHYMAPPYAKAMACLTEIQDECYKLGIPLRTRHREVAPNQYEFAPLFGTATTQIDQNLMVMQIMTEVTAKHGMACLLQEKPFQNVNGSGKHNNWSLGTLCGTNLLNPAQVEKNTGNGEIFPVILAALIRSIDMHGDLMRMAVSCPGNDFRLGACEAPPAIISTYLGDDVTNFMEAFKNGKTGPYKASSKVMDVGVPSITPFTVPSEDRNRTSPFPYGGARFEFRAVGSTQNVSIVNTVLATLAADGFKAFADAIEAGATPQAVASEALSKHWRCIFNGNGYSAEWPEEAVKRGVWKIDSGVEATNRMVDSKNIQLFEAHNVFTKAECESRAAIQFDYYSGVVEMEALCMVDMINQQIIPAVRNSGFGDEAALKAAVASVSAGLHAMHAAEGFEKAKLARVLRLETMMEARAVCDATEAIVPADKWPMPTYKDLLFLDYTA